MDQKQEHYAVGRWFQIIWLSMIAVPLAMAIHEWALRKTAARVISTLIVLPELAVYLLLMLVSCLIFSLIMNVVPLRWQHLWNSGRYPSVWLSGILGGLLAYPLSALLVASGLGSALPHFSPAAWCISLLIYLSSVIAAMMVHRSQMSGLVNWIAEEVWPLRATAPAIVQEIAGRQAREANAPATPPRDLLTLSSDVSALLKWIRQESPIEDPSLDILGRQSVARLFCFS